MTEPRIGLPFLGTPAQAALDKAGVSLPEQPPLPELSEPEARLLDEPSTAPLVILEHPRIDWLSHYERGGWINAISTCWLRDEVAKRLVRVVEGLPDDFGLAVFDAWRPGKLQVELYEHAYADPELPPGFLAVPSKNERLPAPHETGGAVDLTLTVGGVPIAAGTDFDDFTARASTAALEGNAGADRETRRFLYRVMNEAGFVVLKGEWWHFEYGTTRWAALTGRAPIYGAVAPSN